MGKDKDKDQQGQPQGIVDGDPNTRKGVTRNSAIDGDPNTRAK
ncbi:hypothetical protein ABDK56_04670 [Sphingomonas sp. ASV193]